MHCQHLLEPLERKGVDGARAIVQGKRTEAGHGRAA
jgi:hypothetical protein